MTISRDEALSLLNKWRTDSIKVVGVIIGPFSVVAFEGFIYQTSVNALMIHHEQRPTSPKDLRFVGIDLDAAQSFMYGDYREIDMGPHKALVGTIESALTIQFPDGKVCVVEASGYQP